MVDRPLLDTRLSPQGSHAGSEAGMARSCLASAPFCSACSQAAELTWVADTGIFIPMNSPVVARTYGLGGSNGDLVWVHLLSLHRILGVSRNGMPRLRATYKGRDAESSPQGPHDQERLVVGIGPRSVGAFQRLPRTDIRWP